MQSPLASSILSKQSSGYEIPTPDLRKCMIDSTGRLVYKPEYEHESFDYKANATSGAYYSSCLNINDDHPVNKYANQKFYAVQQSAKKNVRWLRDAGVASYAGLKRDVGKVRDAYHAIATPTKKHYRAIIEVPARVNEKLKKENRAIKSELELVQLKLAETRLQMHEARLRSRECGSSLLMGLMKVLAFVLCLLATAWLFDCLVLDSSFDAFEDWLLIDV